MQPIHPERLTYIERVSRDCRISAASARDAIQRSHQAIAAARKTMQRTHAAIDRSEIVLKSAVLRVEGPSALLR